MREPKEPHWRVTKEREHLAKLRAQDTITRLEEAQEVLKRAAYALKDGEVAPIDALTVAADECGFPREALPTLGNLILRAITLSHEIGYAIIPTD